MGHDPNLVMALAGGIFSLGVWFLLWRKGGGGGHAPR